MRSKIPEENIREMDVAMLHLSGLIVHIDLLLRANQARRERLVCDL